METAPADLAKAATRQILVVSTVSFRFVHMTAKSHTLVRKEVCSHSMAFQGFNSPGNGKEQTNPWGILQRRPT